MQRRTAFQCRLERSELLRVQASCQACRTSAPATSVSTHRCKAIPPLEILQHPTRPQERTESHLASCRKWPAGTHAGASYVFGIPAGAWGCQLELWYSHLRRTYLIGMRRGACCGLRAPPSSSRPASGSAGQQCRRSWRASWRWRCSPPASAPRPSPRCSRRATNRVLATK